MATLDAAVARIDALEATTAGYAEALDTIWMLLAAMLVFFMHAGFSMLEAGCVRAKNAQNILAKNLIVVTCGFLCWYFLGYGFALGIPDKPNGFIGANNFVTHGFFFESPDLFRVWFFQGAFCATAATIVSGAMAERTQLKGFATYTTLMTSFIYPVVIYWGWSGEGWLSNSEGSSVGDVALIDFAGSGLVHLVGGVGALVGAIAVGARNGRWEEEEDFNAHSIPFCVLGTFFLWFGWYGFNPGSTLSMHDAETAYAASLVAVNTTLAPCVAGLVVFLLRAKVCEPKCLDVGGFCNGILAGLVSITAGCGIAQPWESLIIGFFGGIFYQLASIAMKKCKVDDVVDAVAVHGACGLWGLLSTGLFGDPDRTGGNGLFHTGKFDQFGLQLLAGLVIVTWVGGLSSMVFIPLRIIGFLRMGDEFQKEGADKMEHSPPKAYSDKKDES